MAGSIRRGPVAGGRVSPSRRVEAARAPGTAVRPRSGASSPVAVRVFHDPEPLVAAWEALADRCDAGPFLRHGWVAPYSRAFARGRTEFWSAWRGNALVALVPLERHRGVLRSPTNFHTPEFGLLSADRDAARALLGRAARSVRRRLDLDYLGRDDADAVVDAVAGTGARVLDRAREPSAHVLLQDGWDGYEASLGRNLRRSLRRGWRKLQEQGEVTVDVVRDLDGLDARLAEFLAVEAAGWKGEGGTAVASQPHTLRFYTEVARWAAEHDYLRLFVMRLDGRVVAAELDLRRADVAWSLKCAYDERYRRRSPGNLLLHRAMSRLHEEGVERVELLEGSSDYKRRWTPHATVRRRVQLFPPTPAGLTEWAAWSYGRPLAKQAVGMSRQAGERVRARLTALRGAPGRS